MINWPEFIIIIFFQTLFFLLSSLHHARMTSPATTTPSTTPPMTLASWISPAARSTLWWRPWPPWVLCRSPSTPATSLSSSTNQVSLCVFCECTYMRINSLRYYLGYAEFSIFWVGISRFTIACMQAHIVCVSSVAMAMLAVFYLVMYTGMFVARIWSCTA